MINKKWIRGIIVASMFGLCSMVTYAESTMRLQGDLKLISGETTWKDSYDAPAVRITVKDGYRKAGQTEKFILRLEGATWADPTGASLTMFNLKGVEMRNIALMSKGETEIQVYLDIPKSTKEGDEISFDVPLLVRTLEESPSIAIVRVDKAEIMTEEKVKFATNSKYKVELKIGEVPTLVKEGEIAPIILDELIPNGISGKELRFKLKLENSNFTFAEPSYVSKDEHDDTIDYILDHEKYLTYEGAFKNNTGNVKFKKYKRTDQEVEIVLTADGNTDTGKMILHNLKVVNTSNTPSEEDVYLTVKCDEILNAGDHITVAHILTKSQEEKEEEEAIKEKEEAEKEEAERQERNSVTFTIGRKQYYRGKEAHDMDAAPYLMAPGYTMVPVRYVAFAFGVSEEDISFAYDTAFIKYGDRTIELTVGSDQVRINNIALKMSTAPTLKEGRIYAPIGEVAKILNIDKQWRGDTQTAIFTEK